MTDQAVRATLDAEIAVLGGLLIEPALLDQVADVVTTADFYLESHAEIYAAMLLLHERRDPIDATTLLAVLHERATLGRIGGAAYLGALTDQVPVAAHVPTYARCVADAAWRRRISEAGQHIVAAADGGKDTATYAAESETRLLEAATPPATHAVVDLVDAAVTARAHLHGTQAARIPTGYAVIDDKIGGFLRGTLVVLGARPGTGKSIVASDLALRGAIPHGVAVLHRSLEMSRMELILRAVARRAEIANWKLQRGYVTDAERGRADLALAALAPLPWLIRDEPATWVQDMRFYERLLRQRPEIGMLIVDHVGLIRGVEGGSLERRHLVIGEITSALCDLAKRRNIVVVLVSQLNRAMEQQGRPPQLSDLRESGSLEQDASVVIFLHAPDKDTPGDDWQRLDVILAKNRQGPVGAFPFHYRKQYCAISDCPPVIPWGAQEAR